MVDEIKVGLLISAVTLTVATFFLLSAFQSSSALKANIAAAKEGQVVNAMSAAATGTQSADPDLPLQQIDLRDPEKSLRDLYEAQAKSELDRCLGNGSGSGGMLLSSSCSDTMKLLYDSCKDPSMHIAACEDPRLKEHFQSS